MTCSNKVLRHVPRATKKQLQWLREHGVKFRPRISVREASQLIRKVLREKKV